MQPLNVAGLSLRIRTALLELQRLEGQFEDPQVEERLSELGRSGPLLLSLLGELEGLVAARGPTSD